MGFAAAAPMLLQMLPGVLNMLNSGGDDYEELSNYNKGQNEFFDKYTGLANQSFGGMEKVMGLLQSMLDPNSDFYKNFEKQQMNQFNQETIPNLAERFAGLDAGGGALSSSGFGQALSTAGSNLQTNLASGKTNMIMKALEAMMNQYNQQANTVLGAKPFDLKEKGGNPLSLFTQGLGNINPGAWQGMTNSWGGGAGSGNKFPLTAGYDTQFRQGGVF